MAIGTTSQSPQRPDLSTFLQLDLEMNRRGYVATRIMPPLEVAVSVGKYRRVQLKSLLANASADTKRTSRGGYNEGDYEFDHVAFQTQEHGWKATIDDREDAIYDDDEINEMLATERCWEVLLNSLEGRVLSKAITAVVAASQTTSAAATWPTSASAKPITDVYTACEAVWARTGVWPNTVAMSRKTFRACRQAAQVIDALEATGAGGRALQGDVTEALLAQAFDVERVVISDAIKNTANIGQDAVIASVFPDANVWVGCVAQSQDIKAPGFGRILHWGGDGSRISGGRLVGVVERYRDEETRADKIRVRHETDEHILYEEMAQVITGTA